jgi:hypothetical protein
MPEISRFEGLWRDIKDMIKILFVCHGRSKVKTA